MEFILADTNNASATMKQSLTVISFFLLTISFGHCQNLKNEVETKGEISEIIDASMVNIDSGLYPLNERLSIEVPAHKISKYEVTQAIWQAVMGNNPSQFKDCDQCPVENVSWNDTQEFIRKLNDMENTRYRLPTHPEWFYAVRGGNKRKGFVYYKNGSSFRKTTWCLENSQKRTHPVGEKEANELGLYDLNGNVWEWVADVWPDDYDKGIRSTHDRAVDKSDKILLGGSWVTSINNFYLIWYSPQFSSPDYKSSNLGFRLASDD